MKSAKEAAEAYAINKHPVVIGRRSATSENFIAGHDRAINELEDITNRYNALSLANAELTAEVERLRVEAEKSITLANENKKLRQMADEPIDEKESAK